MIFFGMWQFCGNFYLMSLHLERMFSSSMYIVGSLSLYIIRVTTILEFLAEKNTYHSPHNIAFSRVMKIYKL